VASRTDGITLGTGIINTWGRTPASIAMMSTSLTELSGDRFVLGLGAGSPPLAEGLHDVAFEAPAQRTTRPLKLAVTPRTAIPLYLAALGPSAVRLAGELADGWEAVGPRPAKPLRGSTPHTGELATIPRRQSVAEPPLLNGRHSQRWASHRSRQQQGGQLTATQARRWQRGRSATARPFPSATWGPPTTGLAVSLEFDATQWHQTSS